MERFGFLNPLSCGLHPRHFGIDLHSELHKARCDSEALGK